MVCGAGRGPNVSRGGLFTQEVPESRKDEENTANSACEKLKLHHP